MAGNAAPRQLTDHDRNMWNMFVDYMQKQGYKGSSALDNRNMTLGKGLLERFNQMNSGSTIRYEDIPAIQTALQTHRNNLIQQWRAGTAVPEGIKSEDELMPGLSKVDGWLGSKTSSYKFPVAVLNTSDGGKQNFGTDIAKYDSTVHK